MPSQSDAAHDPTLTRDQRLTARFKEQMERKNITQAALGSKTGRSQPTINNLFRGVKSYSPEDMFAIARALGVNIDDIVLEMNQQDAEKVERISDPNMLSVCYRFIDDFYTELGKAKSPSQLGSFAAMVLLHIEKDSDRKSLSEMNVQERKSILTAALLRVVAT